MAEQAKEQVDVKQVKGQIDLLIQLQEMDNAISKIENKIDRVPEKIQEIENALAAFSQVVESETDTIESLKTEYRQHESNIADNEDKIKKSNIKLDSVKKNKEYQATLKEIDDIKDKNSQIEDKMIECLDRIEAAEKKFGSKKEALSVMKRDVAAQIKEIEKESDEEKEKLKGFIARKKDITTKIDAKVMADFQKTRGIVGLITIARVENAVCHGCYMNIPPQKYNEMQRFDRYHYCPNCHRMVYWKEETRGSE